MSGERESALPLLDPVQAAGAHALGVCRSLTPWYLKNDRCIIWSSRSPLQDKGLDASWQNRRSAGMSGRKARRRAPDGNPHGPLLERGERDNTLAAGRGTEQGLQAARGKDAKPWPTRHSRLLGGRTCRF